MNAEELAASIEGKATPPQPFTPTAEQSPVAKVETPPVAAAPLVEEKRPRKPPAAPAKEKSMPQVKSYFSPTTDMDTYFPSSQHLVIRRVREDGQVVFVRNATKTELEHAGSVDALLQKNVWPQTKATDYIVELIGTGGEILKKASIVIDPPLSLLPSLGDMPQVPAAPPAPQKDFFQQLDDVERAKKALGMNEKSDNPMMTMLLMQMLNKPAETPPSAPQHDPLMLRLVERWSQPPPAAPPPPSAAEIAAAMMQTMTPLLERLVPKHEPPPPPKNPFDEFDKLAGMLETMKKLVGSDKLEKQLEDLKKKIEEGQEENGGLLDEMETLEKVIAFSDRIKGVKPGQTNIIGDIKDLVREAPRVLDSWADARAKVVSSEVGARVQAQQQPQQRPTGRAQAQQQSAQRRVLQYPADMEPHVTPIAQASDDPTRIRATINLLMWLGRHDQWTPFINGMLDSVRKRNEKACIEFVRHFIVGLNHNGKLNAENSKATIMAFVRNIRVVIDGVNAQLAEVAKEKVNGAQQTQPAQPQPQPAPAQPTP